MPLELVLVAAMVACPLAIVHDGDTIRCGRERVRIVGIDAPELPGSSKCEPRPTRTAWCDYQAGYRSRDALRGFLARGPVMIDRRGVDRYGRTLARVTVNGVDAGRFLIAQGLARRWR